MHDSQRNSLKMMFPSWLKGEFKTQGGVEDPEMTVVTTLKQASIRVFLSPTQPLVSTYHEQ